MCDDLLMSQHWWRGRELIYSEHAKQRAEQRQVPIIRHITKNAYLVYRHEQIGKDGNIRVVLTWQVSMDCIPVVIIVTPYCLRRKRGEMEPSIVGCVITTIRANLRKERKERRESERDYLKRLGRPSIQPRWALMEKIMRDLPDIEF